MTNVKIGKWLKTSENKTIKNTVVEMEISRVEKEQE